MKALASILFLFLALRVFPQAAEIPDFPGGASVPPPAAPPPRNLSFELQIIDVPAVASLPIIAAFRNPAQAEASLTKLHTLLQQKKAHLAGVLYLSTTVGERAHIENVKEVRYPIKFEPPRISVEPNPLISPTENTAPNSPKVAKPPESRKIEAIAAVPDAFETRKVGTTLELEAQLQPDEITIGAQIGATRVFLKGMEKHTIISAGKETVFWQPAFTSSSVNNIFRFSNNQPVLIGTFDSPEKEGWVELFILRAKIETKP